MEPFCRSIYYNIQITAQSPLLNNPLSQYEERTAKLKADVPQLEAIISKSWGKEEELKQLKSDLVALDCKITAALAPTHEVPDDRMGVNKEEQDSEEVKRDEQSQRVEAPAQSAGSKESMVAEPTHRYQSPPTIIRPVYRPAGL